MIYKTKQSYLKISQFQSYGFIQIIYSKFKIHIMIKKQVQYVQKQKVYTEQEVIKLYKKQLESKIIIFKRIVEEKQQIIKQLSHKLQQNQQKISKQQQIIKSLQQQFVFKASPNAQKATEYQNGNIDQLKYKKIFYSIASIKIQTQKRNQKLQTHLSKAISKLQKVIADTIQMYKSKSNQYWQSIKNALNKLNKKIQTNQLKISHIQQSIKNFNSKVEMSKQFEKCKNVLIKFQSIREQVQRIQQRCNFIKDKQQSQNPTQISKIELQISKEGYLPMMRQFHQTYDRETPTWGDNDNLLQSRNKRCLSSAKKMQNSMISFNSSNALHITSLLNLSMQSRKSMMDNCKQRLTDLISAKQLQKPIKCFLDPINYVKVASGNYLFDLKGNMFKINKELFKTLQNEGILQSINEIEDKK